MSGTLRKSLQLSAFVGEGQFDRDVPAAVDLAAMLQQADAWGEVCIYPRTGDFPRANVDFRRDHGFVFQCFEHERSWSHFLVSGEVTSEPQVEIELGGLALERWPSELFVPEPLLVEALEFFLDRGKQKPSLRWVRIDEFPRQIVWEGREERHRWEASKRIDGGGDV